MIGAVGAAVQTAALSDTSTIVADILQLAARNHPPNTGTALECRDLGGTAEIVGMIVCAVNTCGDFKAIPANLFREPPKPKTGDGMTLAYETANKILAAWRKHLTFCFRRTYKGPNIRSMALRSANVSSPYVT